MTESPDTQGAPRARRETATGDTARGIGLMIGATFLLVLSDTFVKYLVTVLPWEEVVWGRVTVQTAIVFALFGRSLPKTLVTRAPGLQIVRSILLVVGTGCFFFALQTMPLADGQAVMAIIPLVVTALAVPFLGERVGPRRWGAVLVGFAGALIIIRPGTGAFGWVGMLPLIAACGFGTFQILTRHLSTIDSSRTTLAHTALVGTVLLTPLMAFVWQTPTVFQALMMLTSGAVATVAHFLMIRSFALVPASVATPFTYTMLIWATVNGFVVFGDFPDVWTFAGAGLIVSGGLYVFHRERAASRAAGSA